MQFLAHEEMPSADKFRPRDEYFIIIGFGPSANASAGGADEMGSPVTLMIIRQERITSAREVPVKKYVVRLSPEEREQLRALIRKGKSSAQRLMKARILLKADVSEDGEGWSDSEIVEALDTSLTTVWRTRQQLVEEGFEAVLSRKGPSRSRRPRDRVTNA